MSLYDAMIAARAIAEEVNATFAYGRFVSGSVLPPMILEAE